MTVPNESPAAGCSVMVEVTLPPYPEKMVVYGPVNGDVAAAGTDVDDEAAMLVAGGK